MGTSNTLLQATNQSQIRGLVFSASEITEFANFYSILIRIDQRLKRQEAQAISLETGNKQCTTSQKSK